MHNMSLHGEPGGRCSDKPCSCYKCWLDVYAHYASLTKCGVVILAGTLDLFQRWANSEACREEVKLIAQGRLFAFVNGYLLAVDMHKDTASASVSDCTTGGVVVWGSGNYYEGGLKGGHKHGQGTQTWAEGTTYTGGFVDSNMRGQGTLTRAGGNTYTGGWVDNKKHGQGTFKWTDGDTYTGDYVADKLHGQGTRTFAKSGKLQKGRFENNKFMG